MDTRANDTIGDHGVGSTRSRSDGGQAAVFVVIVAAVLLVVIGTAVAGLGRAAADRAQAQTAADAAALAALDGGRTAATRLAAMNNAILVSWRRGPGPGEVTVVVSVDGVQATARATDRP